MILAYKFIFLIIIAGLISFVLFGCTEKPFVDPYSPWYNIPKPIDCGHDCQMWIEPGMMVKK